MARAPKEIEERPPHDAIEGVRLPRQTNSLYGHREAEEVLLEAFRSGRMHHAWLILGRRGIGRATLAFRFARFALRHPDPQSADVQAATDLAVPESDPIAHRIAIGAHPNLLHLQREWDDRGKRYRSELSVDTIRRITPFVGTTAGEGGWRIIIVDTADDMNRNAANALLKSLEEPPKRTLFFLLSESRGSLLPTILSRTRTLRLEKLDETDIAAAIGDLGISAASGAERDLLLGLAEGSPRRFVELEKEDGLTLYRMMLRAIEGGDATAQIDLSAIASDTGSNRYQQFFDLFHGYLNRRIHRQPEPGRAETPERVAVAPLVTWAELWEKATRTGRDVEAYNLDRRQFILDLVETAAAALNRTGAPVLR